MASRPADSADADHAHWCLSAFPWVCGTIELSTCHLEYADNLHNDSL